MFFPGKSVAPLAVLVATVLATPFAAAQTEGALPPVQSAAGVKYVPGGVGKAESEAMLRESKRYPLALVFSGGKANHYLANVDIHVRDAAGKTVLQANIGGPMVLVDLPAGQYVVDAQYKGQTVRQRIEISAKGAKRVDLHWPSGE